MTPRVSLKRDYAHSHLTAYACGPIPVRRRVAATAKSVSKLPEGDDWPCERCNVYESV